MVDNYKFNENYRMVITMNKIASYKVNESITADTLQLIFYRDEDIILNNDEYKYFEDITIYGFNRVEAYKLDKIYAKDWKKLKFISDLTKQLYG